MLNLPSKYELTQAFNFIKDSEIPKVPEVVLVLQKEISKQEPDLAKIGKLLETDIALSGLALKTVNSAIFGLSREIESITQATLMLGLNTLKEVILASALKQAMGEATHFQTTIWRSAQGSALGAKALAYSIDGISPETAYIAGLFQNVGALLIEKKHIEYADLYMKGLAYPMSMLEKENDRYGTNHTVIGYLLAKHWKLPDKVCLAIYNSHIRSCTVIEDQETRALISILKVTDNTSSRLLCDDMEFSDEASISLADGYMELIVDDDALDAMNEKIKQGIW